MHPNYFHKLYKAEGKDTLDAAIAATDKAAHWLEPQHYHAGMFEEAVRMATLRSNIALAVEIRKLREAMQP